MNKEKLLPYLIEMYHGTEGNFSLDNKSAECVVWGLNSGNALLKVQKYYSPVQHSYIVKRVRKIGDIADLTQSTIESINFEKD